MALDMTPEQKEIGKANFHRAVGELSQSGVTRRDFMKGLLAAGAAVPISAAAYFGYEHAKMGKPVKVGLIGAGDEGGVLVGEHNPKYLEFIAYSDIRPFNQERIFKGEPTGPRKGFNFHYGKDAAKKITKHENYKELLENKDIEAVVIALPLHLHAAVAIEALKASKHVLCEKLMAWNITQCKAMIKAADETDRILSIGHQRHYSMLYAHAFEVLKSGVLGNVKHIRALWHRNQTNPYTAPKDGPALATGVPQPTTRDSWFPPIYQVDLNALADRVKKYGYKNVEELIRWRLYNRTGGGLMAELGSHQLDACSIFLGKVHPLAVCGVGTKSYFRPEREVDDHVFVTLEFPGENYYADKERKAIKDKDDIVVVTYSSINTNSFEKYGECVMGTKGSMVVEEEQNVMLYPERGGRSTALTVSTSGGQPVLDSSGSTGAGATAAAAAGQASLGSGSVSRGYREEMEHFAYCIRMWQEGASKQDRPLPRCHGRVAMADAIIALTANQAMKRRQRIEFDPKWFDAAAPDVPDKDMRPEIITA